jgi:hypothetical protein
MEATIKHSLISLMALLLITMAISCEDNNTTAPTNNTTGGGTSTTDLCLISINDTNGIDNLIQDTIFFPYIPGCTGCLSKAEVKNNIDLDNDGQTDDTRIRISSTAWQTVVTISFENGVFQGPGNYSMWDSTITGWTKVSDFDLDITMGSQSYTRYRIKEIQTFNLNTFSSVIGQRISGSFIGSLQPMCCGFPIYTVPVQVNFNVPVTTN